MNSFVYQWLFFILIFIKSTYNYPTGAPVTACTSMTPGHGVSSQACSTNYRIQSDKSQYYTTETVRIIVNGSTSSDTFRGILLIAKTETSGQIIGSWSVVNSNIQTIACGGTANTGVTHISNSDKSSIEAIWSPPSIVSTENTIIRATIVKNFTTIYVNCFSVTLTNRQNNQSSNATVTTSSSSTTVATTTVSQTSNIGVNVTWTYNNNITAVKMQINNLQTSQWLALGLSLDQSMGEDHVFVCKRLADDTVMTQRLINPDGHSFPVLASSISNPGGTFNITLEKLENGAAYCEFTLSNFASSKRRRRAISSLSQSISYYPLIAIGNLDASNELTKHTSRSALSQRIQLNQQETIVYNIDSSESEKTGLIKAHGIIMIFAWILFASTGILSARYFKPSWPEKKPCGKAIWFTIHRTIMISVVILTIIAFILILVYEKGTWVTRNEQRVFAHSIVGIITISFAIIQPIMALFRCKPDAQHRFIFNYAHAFIGSTAFILSIVAMFLAMFFTQFNFQNNKQWGILVAWICWVFVIFVVFWFIDFYFKKYGSHKNNSDSYDLTNATPENDPVQMKNQVKQDRIKLTLLIIHIVVAFGLALALSIVVGNI